MNTHIRPYIGHNIPLVQHPTDYGKILRCYTLPTTGKILVQHPTYYGRGHHERPRNGVRPDGRNTAEVGCIIVRIPKKRFTSSLPHRQLRMRWRAFLPVQLTQAVVREGEPYQYLKHPKHDV